MAGLLTASSAFAFDSDRLTNTVSTVAKESGAVGFAVGVLLDDKLIYAEGFGSRRLGESGDVDENTNFHWASVSKPLVATAIMQLHEKNELDLDARLVDLLPEFRVSEPGHRRITIRQLLLHTSGMPDVDDYEWDEPQYDAEALKQWVTALGPRNLLFEPGTDREYSNIGYEVLGAVIEQISGHSFSEHMKQSIFEPLGMTQSSFDYREIAQDRRSAGHTGPAGSKVATPDYPYNRRHEPSSTLNSSIEEMAQYGLAMLNQGSLHGKRILKPDTLAEMWAPRLELSDDGTRQATLGWVRERREGVLMLRHFGGDEGYRSALILMPELNAGILYVSNDEDGPMRPVILAALAEIVADAVPEQGKSRTPTL